MRKTWGALTIAAVTIAALAGCSAGADQSKIDAYRQVVRAMPAYEGVTDAGLDKAAKGVCGIFKADEKSGWAVATDAATQTGADSAQANVLVQAAVAAYCPEYAKDIPASVK